MKINPIEFKALEYISTLLKFILEFGILFCIVGIGAILGLWNFSWGGVLVLHILMDCHKEIQMAMAVMGLEKDDGDDNGS